MVSIRCEQFIKRWFAEVEGAGFEPSRAVQAARDLATCLGDSAHMQQLFEALRGEFEDRISCEMCQSLLPEYIHAQLSVEPEAQVEFAQDVTNHVALCPHCAEAYAEAMELVVAFYDAAIPVALTYPAIDMPRVSQPSVAVATTPLWAADVVRRAIAEGKLWVEDSLGGIYLWFERAGQPQGTFAMGVKAGEPGALLAQTVWDDEGGEGWEVEASVFQDAENADLCRVEVAVYQVGDPDAKLAGWAVTLAFGEVMQTQVTDEGGIVEFVGIPRRELGRCAVRVGLTGA